MTPGRNDPCPCGSGRKYKRCCADADARAASTTRLLSGGAASGAVVAPAALPVPPDAPWEVDAAPIPATIGDTPDARLVAVLVGAAGLVLHVDTTVHPPSEPGDVAELLAGALETAAARQGWPTEVLVRHARVASALAPLLARRHPLRTIAVRHVPHLPTLDEVAAELRANASGHAVDMGPVMAPETWAAWGLPRELVADLFTAAAAFHHARPWTHLYNYETLRLAFPTPTTLGDRWAACVMGNGGEQFGLALYSDEDDLLGMLDGAGPDGPFRHPSGAIVTLDLTRRNELPRPMQREIAAAHWEVAGPDAYPRLWCINTPAGGLPRADAQALVQGLGAVARFAAAHDALLATHPVPDEPLTWTDPETGVVVTYEGDVMQDDEPLWDADVELAPGGATGPGADPSAVADADTDPEAFTTAQQRVVQRYARALDATSLSETTRRRHRMNAELFVEFLAGWQGVGLPAVHEYDLRVFLYDWFPRKARTGRTDAMAMPASLRRFFRWLSEHEGIACPWADGILLDRESYAERWETFPGGSWWDAGVNDWRGEFSLDLDARAMLPRRSLGDDDEWGAAMGMDEARLHGELQRRWLVWRDEAIAEGITTPAEARRVLGERQRAWETTPHPGLGGRTPLATIRRERKARP